MQAEFTAPQPARRGRASPRHGGPSGADGRNGTFNKRSRRAQRSHTTRFGDFLCDLCALLFNEWAHAFHTLIVSDPEKKVETLICTNLRWSGFAAIGGDSCSSFVEPVIDGLAEG